jgi:capsular polysaccharide export protein
MPDGQTIGGDAIEERRSFLFLQGPIASFFDRLGATLIARGHRVHRINLHFGDQLFWRLPATNYRGRFEDWRGFVAGMMEQHQITDLVLHGDRRPYHIVAAEEARARGIAVIATDLGYVRPDWITLEYDGMTTYSRFPRDPAAIRALAAQHPEPELGPRFHTPFWLIAALDVAYNLGLVFGRPLYPHYRYHSISHPFAEYAGWLWSRTRRLFTARATAAEKRRLETVPGSYFLVPLQIATDYQIRAHSPFRGAREAVHEIIASFAKSGSRRKLVFVVHPLDNGLIDWHRLITRLAGECGVARQVLTLDGGTPGEVLRSAAGVVTINSTVGVTALHHGVPVKVLGNAVFDIAGLTCQSPLAAFWHDPVPPDSELMAAFLRALIGTTQVKGGYYEPASQACAIAGFVERLEQGLYPLPPLSEADLARRPPRASSRTVVVADLSEVGLQGIGVAEGIAVALARAYAAPGVNLCLVGGVAETLGNTADDCRRRGALVETFDLTGRAEPALADYLAALDRRSPVDTLVVHAGPRAEPVDRHLPAGYFATGRLDEAEIGGARRVVDAIGEPMRCRGRGEIVLIDSLAGRPAAGAPGAVLGTSRALRSYGAALRRQLRACGVSVAVVLPRSGAIRAAARLREPGVTLAGADRIAERIARGLPRRRAVFAIPGPATLTMRTLRVVPSRVREAVRTVLLPSPGAIREPADEGPLPGESGPGD